MRQIVLDTETTGLEVSQGHRIIEIGCVELVNRKLTGNHFHQYINPDREIDQGAIEVHGITNDFLSDKPDFATIVNSGGLPRQDLLTVTVADDDGAVSEPATVTVDLGAIIAPRITEVAPGEEKVLAVRSGVPGTTR